MIDLDDYWRWDATDMAHLVRHRQVHPDELHEACVRAARATDPAIHAIAELHDHESTPDLDRSAPLAGVPLLVKELTAVPGFVQSFGSRLMAGNVVTESSPYVDALRACGLRPVGTTTSSEMGLLGSTETLLHGATVNPWRPGWSAAGSSGGSAAAVAAGVVPVAHASDGGGSIRVPASVTGLFGFKPSNGRCLPSGPEMPGLGALVVDHVVSRSVRDSAAVLAYTERPQLPADLPPVGHVVGPAARRLRVGLVERTLLGALPSAAVRRALASAAALVGSLGHTVVELGALDVDGQAVSDAFFVAAGVTIAGVADMVTPMLGRAPGADEFEPFTLELVDWARRLPIDALARAEADMSRAAAAMAAVFASVDVVLSPTLAEEPWELGRLSPALGRDELIRRTGQLVGYTPIHNLAGSPGMSVPLSVVDGLPIGMHFAAARGSDATLLALAYELESATDWGDRLPRPVAMVDV
ncbi:MAG: amidase family protein [Acidimicrobiales bacterium]